jgi:hypothetical protein
MYPSHHLSNSLHKLRYSLHAYEISSLFSRTLGRFHILVLEPCNQTRYYDVVVNLYPPSVQAPHPIPLGNIALNIKH